MSSDVVDGGVSHKSLSLLMFWVVCMGDGGVGVDIMSGIMSGGSDVTHRS